MSDDNDELKEMLAKYRAPAEAGELRLLKAAARFLYHELQPPPRFGPGGHWYWNLHFSKKELSDRKVMIPAEVGILDLDPKRVAAIFKTNYSPVHDSPVHDEKIADMLISLPHIIAWLTEFEQALRDNDGDEEVEVNS